MYPVFVAASGIFVLWLLGFSKVPDILCGSRELPGASLFLLFHLFKGGWTDGGSQCHGVW
jgi:hypothetical protein